MKIGFGSLMSAFLAAGNTFACTLASNDLPTTRLFVSQDLSRYALASEGKKDAISMVNCQSAVQIALGLELPSPVDFSTETWLKSLAPANRRCELRTDLDHVRNSYQDFNQNFQDAIELASECFGLKVSGPTGSTVLLEPSRNCRISSRSENGDTLILKGDNCEVKSSSPMGVLNIEPIYLKESCQNSNAVRTRGAFDMDMTFKILSMGGKDKQSELLGEKGIKVIFSESGKSLQTSGERGQGMNIYKSSKYAVDFDLADLRLTGSTETKLLAGSQFYMSQSSSSPLPMVIKSSLYLVKKGSLERQMLGSWYSGSIIPPRWQGLDGLSHIHSLAVTEEDHTLGASSRNVEKGDLLYYTASLEKPNIGPSKFKSYAEGLANRLVKAKPKSGIESGQTKLGTHEALKALPGLQGLQGLPGLPGLSGVSAGLSQSERALQAFSNNWPVFFDEFCSVNGSQCEPLKALNSLIKVESIYEVLDADFEIKIRPVRYFKTSAVAPEIKRPLSQKTEIQCY